MGQIGFSLAGNFVVFDKVGEKQRHSYRFKKDRFHQNEYEIQRIDVFQLNKNHREKQQPLKCQNLDVCKQPVGNGDKKQGDQKCDEQYIYHGFSF
jgi:hypothetical protein